ncbi:succinoglycan biosynthesis protein ExoO [Paraburkholderia sp. GAS333]|uniref:glycosyltransferase family 2 protein n=1 Tax=Paraburkholderia sp. GAS333 TaxID=3156279 RepID=UPI003D1AFB38
MNPTGENQTSEVAPREFDSTEEPIANGILVRMAAPSVTVIMANYNGQSWIGQAIESVQRQTLADWELIVVDDASTDASVDIVRAAAGNDQRIVLLTSKVNAGPSVARNRALARARGRWTTILDSDDTFDDSRLSSLLAKGESEGGGIIADDLLIMNPGGVLTGHSLLKLQTAKTFDASALVKAPHLAYLKPMIRTELLSGLWYDERLRSGEDFDLLLRVLVRREAGLVVYPGMGYHYRRRIDSLSTNKSADRQALRGMLEANARFRASHALSGRLGSACASRHRSLEASLRWVDVTEAVHERRFAAALRHTIDHPGVLRCAVQFFKKRFYRIVLRNRRRAETLGL